MELFRGDSFYKQIASTYQFRVGDELHIAVMENAYSKDYLYEEVIIVKEETNEIDFEIPTEKTSLFPIKRLLLEIELTTIDGIVQTNQYELNVKADGIREQN